MKTHFLRAEWNNLIMANFAVPPEILLPFVPAKTELDFFEGDAYISLVGLMFLNTRIFGLSIPYHNNFEEVNLRFYVRHNERGNWTRGVVFIKEIVPRQAVAFFANNLYYEKYITLKMKHFHLENVEYSETGYEWLHQNKWHSFSAKAAKKSTRIRLGTSEEFLADHYYGFSKYNDTKTYIYQVDHPVWETFKVLDYSIDCDFGSLYGERFSFLNKIAPRTVLMTQGSQIKIFQKRILD